MEVAAIFYLALDEGYVKEADIEPFFGELEILAKRVATLNRSLAVTTSKTPFAKNAPKT